ncbi:MAG: response regulator [Candidatus Hydrogenedentes bacterium]|nr:response regulator [Candidatus Hydrogenedentota bacterium]
MATILIVDDDERASQLVRDHLVKSGHECTVQRSGQNVLETIQNKKHDLLVLDVMLPHTSGFEICRQIRRDPELYTLPILFLSAMNNEEEVFHGLAQGADDYVAKPFDAGNVVQRIEALLRIGSGGTGVDELTSLPSADVTKREIQRQISLRKGFALAHCELLYVREFGRKYGAEARTKAVRHLGRALARCTEELKDEEIFVGHMGGGHFMVIMSPKRIQAFSRWARKVWLAQIEKLYMATTGSPKPKASADEAEKQLDVMFCITQHDPKETVTPQQIFEVLSQIRHMAMTSSEGGVFADRRAGIE